MIDREDFIKIVRIISRSNSCACKGAMNSAFRKAAQEVITLGNEINNRYAIIHDLYAQIDFYFPCEFTPVVPKE